MNNEQIQQKNTALEQVLELTGFGLDAAELGGRFGQLASVGEGDGDQGEENGDFHHLCGSVVTIEIGKDQQ